MKNVVITGTSRGIGYELVQLYGAKNYNVICLTRDLSTISNSKNISVVSTDLSSPESIKNAVDFINDKFSSVDILINNAGQLINKPFNKTSFTDFESVYKVNVFGVAELIRLLLKSFNSPAHIINISSIGGIAG